MDYRAAATRQLKEGTAVAPSTAKSNSTANPVHATTTEQPKPDVVSPPTDSPKIKGIHSARTSGGGPSNNSHAARKAANSSPLSYAATAAAKKASTAAAAATAASTGASGENGSAGRKGSVRQASPPSMPLAALIGARIRITLTSGCDIEGLVYTYDVYSGVVALVSSLTSDDLPDLQNAAGASPS
ncbi:hypothetical protein GGI21_006662, partial [Coemansia aciculifera]